MTWVGALRRRTRRELVAGLLVVVGLTAFVLVTYVVVVLGGGALTGHTSTPDVRLSVLATAIVALAFDPVQTRLELRASRVVHGQNVSPYDALRQFSQTVTGAYAAEELPARMAHVLADGTGAAWSQVWLVLADRPTLAATWPPIADGAPSDGDFGPRLAEGPGRRSLPVLHGGDVLGFLVVQERP